MGKLARFWLGPMAALVCAMLHFLQGFWLIGVQDHSQPAVGMPLLQGPQPLSAVNARDFWTSKDIPPLGLEPKDEFQFRVYVLRCTPGDPHTSGPFYTLASRKTRSWRRA